MTIAQQFNHDFDNGVFRLFDSDGNQIYYEDSDGFWSKSEYDSNGNKIYLEDSDGYWSKSEYDSNGNKIYLEDSDGYWSKREYDSNGNEIYLETSSMTVIIHSFQEQMEWIYTL